MVEGEAAFLRRWVQAPARRELSKAFLRAAAPGAPPPALETQHWEEGTQQRSQM
jgi:hypothetical protein